MFTLLKSFRVIQFCNWKIFGFEYSYIGEELNKTSRQLIEKRQKVYTALQLKEFVLVLLLTFPGSFYKKFWT